MSDTDTIRRLEQRVAELEALVEKLVATNTRLLAENAKLAGDNIRLTRRVEDLEHRLRQNSSNSNRPPSSDPPGAPPPAPPKPPSGRAPGGQHGHPPHQRLQVPPEQVDRRIPVRPTACRHCRHALAETRPSAVWDSRQVIELPEVRAEILEYERHAVACPGCGAFNLPDWPAEAAAFVGARMQALLALLVGRFRLSRREAEEFVQDVLGAKARICLGSVKNLEERTAAALEAPYAEAVEAARREPVLYADETGWYQRANLVWLWTLTSRALAVFRIDPKRGRQAFRDFAGNFDGVLVSDRWKAYLDWNRSRHQLCWSHGKRDFRKWEDRGGRGRRIGRDALDCENRVFELWSRHREGRLGKQPFVAGIARVRKRLRKILERGTRLRRLKGPCSEFLKYEESLWTFARRRGVDPTNNLAERRIRPGVMWRKICFGTWSEAGSRFTERMLTVAGTLRGQGRSVMAFLVDAIRAWRGKLSPPSLLPVH